MKSQKLAVDFGCRESGIAANDSLFAYDELQH